MDYNELKRYLDNPRPLQGLEDFPRWLRGPYDPRDHQWSTKPCKACKNQPKARLGGPWVYECEQCFGTKIVDPELIADKKLEDAGSLDGWGRVSLNGNVYWTPTNDVSSGITTAELRARLPINGVLDTVECEECDGLGGSSLIAWQRRSANGACSNCNATGKLMIVTRKNPDPVPTTSVN